MSEGTISRRRQFAQVPDALILDRRVNDFAVRLWCRLDHYAGCDGRAFPHVDTLADDLGVSSRTVDRGIRCLVETGWVSRKRRGFSNIVDTVINDDPGDSAQQTSRSDASVQVTAETSDLTFPEAQDLSSPVTPNLSLPKKETHSKETQENFTPPADADSARADDGALFHVPPRAPTQGEMTQILVGAYSDRVPGTASRALLGAIGRNVKRLLSEGIAPPLILAVIEEAAPHGRRDFDKILAAPGGAGSRYERDQAARRRMFAIWEQQAAQYDAMRGVS